MNRDIWYTWHDKMFDSSKYLYHYTKMEKAIKILYNNSLRFSSIKYTNDTVESKVKMSFSDKNITKNYPQKTREIKKYMDDFNKYLQLLCFSRDQDRKRKNYYTKDNDMYHIDMSGRGFSLPRMWAQYADNNQGICFVFNKELFEEELYKKNTVIQAQKVVYKSIFDSFIMSVDTIETLYENICDDRNTTMTGYHFLKNNMDYVRYSYFTKFRDWESENEFRYLIGTDNEKAREVKHLEKYISGIILGERVEPSDEWIIRELAEEKECDVKRIKFEYNCCRLEDD